MDFINHFFNYYGMKMPLLVKQNERFTTSIDKGLGIAVNILILIIIFYHLNILIFHKNPTQTTSILLDDTNTKIYLNKSYSFFAFGTESISLIPFLDERILQIEVAYEQYTFFDNDTFSLDKKILNLVKCDKSNLKFTQDKKQKKITISELYCLENKEDVVLEGSIGDRNWKVLTISLKKCQNTTIKNDCKSEEEIYNYTKSGYLSFYLNDINIIIDNYYDPVKVTQKKYFTTYTSNAFKENIFIFKKVEMRTESSIITNHYKKNEYVNLETITSNSYYIDDRSLLLKTYFASSNIRHVYIRKYTKIFEIISNIYSNSQFIIIFFKLFNYYIQKVLFKNYICSYFTIFPSDKSPCSNSNHRRDKNINKNISLYGHYTPNQRMETINENSKNYSYSFIKSQDKSNKYSILNDSEIKIYLNSSKNIRIPDRKVNNSKNVINVKQLNDKVSKTEQNNLKLKESRTSNISNNIYIKKGGRYINNLLFANKVKANKTHKKMDECELLIKYFCFPESFKLRKKMIDNSYQNARWYFDIIRILKLYSDVENIKKIYIDDDKLDCNDSTEKFCLNSQNIINVLSNN